MLLHVGTRDLHGISNLKQRDKRGKNRGNRERVLTFTAVAVVMRTAVWKLALITVV